MFQAKSRTEIPTHERVLDWRPAEDRSHEFKYRASLVLQTDVPFTVERIMTLPSWHWNHDQGHEGSCVGHGTGMERAISNTRQNRLLSLLLPGRRYDTIDIWNRAKEIDEWSDTNPGDDNGTSVHAGYDVCLTLGLCRVDKMELIDGIPHPINPQPRDLGAGIGAVRWASSVDEMRASLKAAIPVTIGINWYSNFDNPKPYLSYKWPWIGQGDLGSVRGGHCVAIFAASDKRQAFAIKNSWGANYPLIWLPYSTMDRLLKEDGEAALVTDR